MSDLRQCGYMLPDGFTVVRTTFEKVVDTLSIDPEGEEGEALAREALHLYMSGTRNEWELELRLINTHLKGTQPPVGAGDVVDLLPELSAWSRSLTASPSAATDLLEQTLEHAIEQADEIVEPSGVRGWLIRLMVELRLRRSPKHRSHHGL